jgi:hypothetical protein
MKEFGNRRWVEIIHLHTGIVGDQNKIALNRPAEKPVTIGVDHAQGWWTI